MTYPWIAYPEEDFEFILDRTQHYFVGFEESTFLLTGGTGFVGGWMLQFLVYTNRKLKLDFKVDVITRQSITLSEEASNIVSFLKHDLRLPLPLVGKNYSHVMFSSTPSNPKTGGLDSNLVNDSTKLGTKHLIEFLRTQENRVTYLNTSSGGVKNYVSDFSDGDKSINNIYAEAKIEAEKILIREIKDTNIMFKSPRLYSFAGPGIPLDAHFAVGNFMLDALSKRDVVIKGSPDTIRSYLHPIDMTIQMIGCWLGKEKEIFPDIGSFFPISMANLAQTISNILGNGKVKVLNNNQNSSSYFPTHPVFPFNLENIELDESIRRWASWLILNK